jgi:hypothetical protein
MSGCKSPLRKSSLLGGVLASLVVGLAATGCNRPQSERERLEKSLEVNGRTEATVVKFAGTVTVDGQPPTGDRHFPLFVMAYDPKKPLKGRQLPFSTRCNKEGHFEFNTYGTGDGLPAGEYIVIFAWPKADGSDGLKNLFNDPDKNAQDERFKLNLTSPGKTDYLYDLQVAGRDPVTSPGEHAVKADRGKKKRG